MKSGQRKHIHTNAKSVVTYDGQSMSAGEAWVRECCKLYMAAPPIAHYLTYPPDHPDYNPDEPDAAMPGPNGALLPDMSINGGKTDFDMPLGAVWMNRTLMRSAWETITGHHNNVSADGFVLDSNPMRYEIDKRKDEGTIIVGTRDGMMFSEEFLRKLGLEDVYARHKERKGIWGLGAWGDVLEMTGAFDRPDDPTRRMRPNHLKAHTRWETIIARIERCRIIDFTSIHILALKHGISDKNGTSTARKIEELTTWGTVTRGRAQVPRKPKLKQVAKGVYRVLKWDDWSDIPDPADAFTMAKWTHEVIRVFSPIQHANPEATFTVQAVIDYLEPANPLYSEFDKERAIIWNDRFRPKNWTALYIGTQLSRLSNREGAQFPRWKEGMLFVRTKKGQYQIDPTVLKNWFEYDLMTDSGKEVEKLARAIYDLGSPDVPFWFLEEDIYYLIEDEQARESWWSFLTIMKKREWIVSKASAHQNEKIAKKMSPDEFRPALMYILSAECMRSLKLPFRYNPDSYTIPRYDGEHEDNAPKRNIQPAWNDNPEYQQSIEHITRWYGKDFELPEDDLNSTS